MALEEYPVNSSGDLMDYPRAYGFEKFVDNVPFDAVLRVDTYTRGQSSVKLVLVDDTTSRRWPMSITDVLDMLKRANVINGRITGRWIVVKRGANYGVQLMQVTP